MTSITILNPNCEIDDSDTTISNMMKWDEENQHTYYTYTGIICGYDQSTAQAYAQKNNYTFKSLGEAPADEISGECGENLTWTLINGVLTISGSGDMYNWEKDELENVNTPWFADRLRIKSIEITDGVTSIGDYAFSWCRGITTITIPDGVISLGEGSFRECSGLKEIHLPGSLKSIGKWAFEMYHSSTSNNKDENSHLESITIPESVELIEEFAFNFCTALNEITILNSKCVISNNYAINNYNSSGGAWYYGLIRGFKDSTAQAYAERNGFSFEVIEVPFPDMNNDGQITALDAQMILVAFAELLSGNPSNLTLKQETLADVDGKGEITALDAQYVLTYYLYNSVLDNPTTWDEILHPND